MSLYVIKVWAISVQNNASLEQAPSPHITTPSSLVLGTKADTIQVSYLL